MALRVVEYRQFVQILAMFMIVQFVGLLLATQIFTGAVYSQIKSVQVVSSSIDALFYIAYIIIASVVILLIFKVYKGDKLFLVLEAVVIIGASFIVFLVAIASLQGDAFNALFGNTSIAVYVAALALSIALIIAKYKKPSLRNTTAMIASVGVGLVIGTSFSFLVAMIFMVILAVYDFIAVFITKHMIALGNMAIEKNLSLLVMVNEVEAVPLSSLDRKQRLEYGKHKKEAAYNGNILKGIVGSDMVPFSARTALGTGDLAMPLMLAVASYKVNLNFVLPFVIIFGAMFGLILTLFILRRYKRALPAIPPILFGILVSMLIYFIIIHA
ncbi:MAG: presenilin family intramembrane aspartyl protease [Candidatus Micrarchaeaceae archaeon]